jgi:predicted adenylyl cyclase CyaB
MPANIEIKARVADLDRIKAIVEPLSSEAPVTLLQEDTFFACPNGRLKMRRFADGSGELIFYNRPNTKGIRQSNYHKYEARDPVELNNLLSRAYGRAIVVKKKREVFIVGQTRVHLDEVMNLGSFVELEVVLRPDQDPNEGYRIAEGLMKELGIEQEDLIGGAYADLLADASACCNSLTRE